MKLLIAVIIFLAGVLTGVSVQPQPEPLVLAMEPWDCPRDVQKAYWENMHREFEANGGAWYEDPANFDHTSLQCYKNTSIVYGAHHDL